MSQYIVHAAPYSSPNSRKNVKSKWNVQNLRVFQDIPGNPNSTIMAELDLVNANNPKDKKYTMKFSFADGTSMTANAINRIRRFFNEAYDRQRSSPYGFPDLSETEKTQIIARINTAYNQWAGFSHSVNTKPRPQHEGYYSPSLGAHELEFSNTYSLATINGHSTIYLKFRGKYDKTLKGLTVSVSLPVTYTDAKQKIKKDLQKTSYYIPEKDISLAATYAEDVSNQLSHSSDEPDVIDCTSNQDNEPDYLSVKMSDIDDNYLEHAANPYPYRPDVKLDGNQLVITFTDVTNNRTATLSVNLVGAKNYKDVEDRLDNLLQAAYADGKDWGNISKNAFDSIMRQARALNIFNDKTVSKLMGIGNTNRYRRNKSSI